MYESRLHVTNGIVSIAVDACNGELLELVSERTGDNYIKSNCHPKAWSPFMLEIPGDNGTMRHLCPPRYAQILEDPSLQPVITVDQQPDSASVHIDYPAVIECAYSALEKAATGSLQMHNNRGTNVDTRREVKVSVDILLPKGDCRTQWKISVVNGMDEEIQRAVFPCLTGIFLGDTWEDDEIVIPHHAGLRVMNPVKRISETPKTIYWKWQEYRYGYSFGGPYGAKDDRGSYIYEQRYSGGGSMLWTDLFDTNENSGLYMTCRNDSLLLKAVRAETFGETTPGLGISIVHFPCMQPGAEWTSETCIVGVHEGDWHWGADDYREWRMSLPQPETRRHRPEWFEKSPGLVAHYDFKYQGHGVVHHFKDIPGLLEQAREMGFNHLLCSGWNFDGFDHGFPQYWPDPEMGTEADLRDAVHKVREMGGHLAFYINSRLCNTKYPERAKLIQESAIMRKDGSLCIERYGASNLEFACLCNQSKQWRDEFVGVVDYLTHDIGADSMYLDQLAMGYGELCYHPGHEEHADNPAGWNQGYEKMLKQMRDGYDEEGMAMLYEGCSDIHGWGVSGQLISTMFSYYAGSYPEMYKYTFPDQILVDMMNPRRNSGMRAEHIARKSTFLLYRAFVVGSYLWVYDLEMDNTFRRDPEQYERLKHITALRSAWLENYGHGTFRDTIGLGKCTDGLMVKRYDLEDGMLVACANEKRIDDAVVEIIWNSEKDPAVAARTYLAPEEHSIRHEIIRENGCCKVRVWLKADDELAVIVLR